MAPRVLTRWRVWMADGSHKDVMAFSEQSARDAAKSQARCLAATGLQLRPVAATCLNTPELVATFNRQQKI